MNGVAEKKVENVNRCTLEIFRVQAHLPGFRLGCLPAWLGCFAACVPQPRDTLWLPDLPGSAALLRSLSCGPQLKTHIFRPGLGQHVLGDCG